MRREIWERNVKSIEKFNARNESYNQATNQFSDLVSCLTELIFKFLSQKASKPSNKSEYKFYDTYKIQFKRKYSRISISEGKLQNLKIYFKVTFYHQIWLYFLRQLLIKRNTNIFR